MAIERKLIKALGKEECVDILNEVNGDIHSYIEKSPDQTRDIIIMCAMVREQLNYLHLKEKDSGRFISKVIREKIDALDISARKELANKLSSAIDFESRCIVEYINKINYEQIEY